MKTLKTAVQPEHHLIFRTRADRLRLSINQYLKWIVLNEISSKPFFRSDFSSLDEYAEAIAKYVRGK